MTAQQFRNRRNRRAKVGNAFGGDDWRKPLASGSRSMSVVTIQFNAHCGTVQFWKSAAKSYGARTWKGAMRAFARQHGDAIAMLADDSALIIAANGQERRINRQAVIWKGKP